MEGYHYGPSSKNQNILAPQIDQNLTLTSQGPLDNEGIIPRAIRDLFDQVRLKKANSGNKISVKMQYIQLYNEKIFDLLNSTAIKGTTAK